eukprot:COSAG05_NODE_303_length_11737_cov_116.354270_7_plen_65_part_00
MAAARAVGEDGLLPAGTTAAADFDRQFGVKVPIGGARVTKLFRARFRIQNPRSENPYKHSARNA